MPQVSARDFKQLPLRVHDFLAGVPLHDVWAIDLPHMRPGITLDEFLKKGKPHSCRLSPAARALVSIRLFAGRLLGLDREARTQQEAFATRLTDADRLKSLAPVGARDGLFRVVYRFDNEQLVEIINRTAHAAALSALVETTDSYRFYFGVYVRKTSAFTPFYMALIDPFRKLIIYPSMLGTIRTRWDRTFGIV